MATTYDEWKKTAFPGSAAGVGTYDKTQEKIKAQMNANSRAWHTADEAAKAALHEENKRLAGLLGGGVKYDSARGTWSGQAGKTQDIAVPDMESGVQDHSRYIKEMNEAKKHSALAEIEAAYRKNVNALDRAQSGLAQSYRTARSQTAGASELAKRNMAQHAAANGLNSGTGAQAELARNVELMGDLNDINRAEGQSLADIQLKRADAQTEYNTAIAQAQSAGDYELAAALYEEKVRVEDALLDLAVKKYQHDYQAYRDSVADDQWQKTYELKAAEQKESAGGKMTLATAKGLADKGVVTPQSLAVLNSGGYSNNAIKEIYGIDVSGYTTGSDYNNGALTTEQVKEMQEHYGLTADGFWGVNSQSAVGRDANRAWAEYQAQKAENFANYLFQSTKNIQYVIKTMRKSGYSEAEIDAALDRLGI